MSQPLGLPKNAWINSAQYSMTGGFPALAKAADRIYRPDSDARWFTYNGTTWVAEPTIKSGTSTAVYTTPVLGDRLYRSDLVAWYTYNGTAFVADGGSTYTPPALTGTSFPSSPTNGQQFLRTDTGTIGGTAPGRWYTYSTANSLWVPDYLSGVATTGAVTVAAVGVTPITTVSWNHVASTGWVGTPNIFVNNNMTVNLDKVILRAGNPTSTTFTIYGTSSNGVASSVTAGTVIGWYANRI